MEAKGKVLFSLKYVEKVKSKRVASPTQRSARDDGSPLTAPRSEPGPLILLFPVTPTNITTHLRDVHFRYYTITCCIF